MDGCIERIRIYPDKASDGIELAEVRLVENLGLEGDFRAKGGERQVSLIPAECLVLIKSPAEKGLCFARFKENLCLGGLSPADLKPGVNLAIGGALLEISTESKHCHEDCSLHMKGQKCVLAGLHLFAKVVKGGVIRTGDRIEIT